MVLTYISGGPDQIRIGGVIFDIGVPVVVDDDIGMQIIGRKVNIVFGIIDGSAISKVTWLDCCTTPRSSWSVL